MRKKEFLLPKINLSLGFHRREGLIGFISGLFLVLFLAIVLCANLQVESFQASSLYLEDALAASNLASAVIDPEEYGISHVVKIADPLAVYRLYCDAVKGNLGLNDRWEGSNQALIAGPVTVESYILDFEGDIYGETVVLEVHRFLRPIQKFGSLEEVQKQVEKDIEEARKCL